MDDLKRAAMHIARQYDLKKADKETPTAFLYRVILHLADEISFYMTETNKLRLKLVKDVEESDQYQELLDQLKFEQMSHEQTRKELEKLKAATTQAPAPEPEPEAEPEPTKEPPQLRVKPLKKGRPAVLTEEEKERLRDLRAQGYSIRTLVADLQAAGKTVTYETVRAAVSGTVKPTKN